MFSFKQSAYISSRAQSSHTAALFRALWLGIAEPVANATFEGRPIFYLKIYFPNKVAALHFRTRHTYAEPFEWRPPFLFSSFHCIFLLFDSFRYSDFFSSFDRHLARHIDSLVSGFLLERCTYPLARPKSVVASHGRVSRSVSWRNLSQIAYASTTLWSSLTIIRDSSSL